MVATGMVDIKVVTEVVEEVSVAHLSVIMGTIRDILFVYQILINISHADLLQMNNIKIFLSRHSLQTNEDQRIEMV